MKILVRPHRLWSGEPLGIFTPIDVNGLFFILEALFIRFINGFFV